MEFNLLGEIEVRVDGWPVAIRGARLQGVLAVLLVAANRAVPAEHLVDRVWSAHRLPERPANALQSQVTLLRRALVPVEGVQITWQSAGYRLTVDEQLVDMHRFRGLLDQARRADSEDRAAALLEEALGLWSGQPFGTLETPWFTTLRATLTTQHRAARLDLTDIQLRRGQHSKLVADLFDQAVEHPFDERLAGQLMLALYRCGRPAEALAQYQQIRGRLAEELGTDPGEALQELYQQILTADSALALPAVSTGGTVSRAGRPVVPRQLPAPPRWFIGRTRELAALTATLDIRPDADDTVMISAIGGMGGIGKTWLALHWAHQHLDRFPDGQLYVNLRGFDATGDPMSPATAVRVFLDALGVEPGAIPVELQAQVGLYRSLVADQRLLIVLDNAADTTQIIPLLPGSSSCTLLVTSRRRLTGLTAAHGAHILHLDALTDTEARHLLARHLGRDRLTAEPDAVTELLTYCAGLPLAISIVTARATDHPSFPLATLAEELRDHNNRLDVLDGGELSTNLRAVLSWSNHTLDAESTTTFGLLGLAPGPDISLPAVASMIALPTTQARMVLHQLEHAHLIHQHTAGRYRMHDLVRLYAADQAARDQPQSLREAALRRLVDHYLHTAFAGDRLLHPHRPAIELDPPAQGCQVHPLPDQAAALGWFESEHPGLLATQQLAAERAWHQAVWQLAWTLDTFHARRGHPDWLAAWTTGLTAANHLGDLAAQTMAHRVLGHACAQAGRHAEAVAHLHQALTLAGHTGDLTNQAHTHQALARAWAHRGEYRRALEHATHALHGYQTIQNPVWQAEALNAVGWFSARLGYHSEAHTHCGAALALFRHHDDRAGEAATLDSLGYLAHHTGQHIAALGHYRGALKLRRQLGNKYQEADTLDRLGHTHAAIGQPDDARDRWHQALRLYQAQHRSAEADRVQRQLDALGQLDAFGQLDASGQLDALA